MTYDEAKIKWPKGFCLIVVDEKVYFTETLESTDKFEATDLHQQQQNTLADEVMHGVVDVLFTIATIILWPIEWLYARL